MGELLDTDIIVFVSVKYEVCVSVAKMFIDGNKRERTTAAAASCQEVMLHDPNVLHVTVRKHR